MKVTYIGGPTAIIEFAGLRLLTDPTFDPPGGAYTTGPVTLRKTLGPALPLDSLHFDAVLLSHDHHSDNLDHAGREALARASHVITTEAGASRLGGNAVALGEWKQIDVPTPGGGLLQITGIPAQHGPANHDRGPVTGFVLARSDRPAAGIYVSGDTVWFPEIARLRDRFQLQAAILFMGAARVPAVGPWPLTMTAADAIAFAHTYPNTPIVPLHFEGWEHFSESKADITRAFAAAGLESRPQWIEPGSSVTVSLPEFQTPSEPLLAPSSCPLISRARPPDNAPSAGPRRNRP